MKAQSRASSTPGVLWIPFLIWGLLFPSPARCRVLICLLLPAHTGTLLSLCIGMFSSGDVQRWHTFQELSEMQTQMWIIDLSHLRQADDCSKNSQLEQNQGAHWEIVAESENNWHSTENMRWSPAFYSSKGNDNFKWIRLWWVNREEDMGKKEILQQPLHCRVRTTRARLLK